MLPTLHQLLARIHDDIAFDLELTDAGTTAAEAFAGKRGVSQDLAHIFVAVARAIGAPARCVSGYFHHPGGEAAEGGGHAWAEAHLPDLGWIGFDPTNGLCTTDQHIRVAVALDCLGAARVRGAHYGGGRETLAVKLQVTQASWQTQG